MKNPFGGDVRPGQVARYMKRPGRLASLLQEDPGGWGATPAAIFADIVTVLRADQRRLAAVHGIEIEAEVMSEDRAAELIAGVVDGDALDIVLIFNELARQRDEVLREALDEDEYQAFMAAKTSEMHTDDPETWDDDGADRDDDVDEASEARESRESNESNESNESSETETDPVVDDALAAEAEVEVEAEGGDT